MSELEDIEEITNSEEINETNALKNKSIDVYNALNLVNEELGTLYQEEGYNPFDNDFVLTEEYANDVLESKNNNKEIFTESFLEYGNKTVIKHFNNALNNNNEILNKLEDELKKTSDENVKKQIKKAIIFLKNRSELLKHNITKLKNKDANALKMYIELFGLDSELSELLRETYNENINTIIIAQQMLEKCKLRATNLKKKQFVKIKEEQEIENENLNNNTLQPFLQTEEEQEKHEEQEQQNAQETPELFEAEKEEKIKEPTQKEENTKQPQTPKINQEKTEHKENNSSDELTF